MISYDKIALFYLFSYSNGVECNRFSVTLTRDFVVYMH